MQREGGAVPDRVGWRSEGYVRSFLGGLTVILTVILQLDESVARSALTPTAGADMAAGVAKTRTSRSEASVR